MNHDPLERAGRRMQAHRNKPTGNWFPLAGSRAGAANGGQFFWTRQLPPADFRFEHNSFAWSAGNGPTMARK